MQVQATPVRHVGRVVRLMLVIFRAGGTTLEHSAIKIIHQRGRAPDGWLATPCPAARGG
jgi:hypothetical protein